MHSMETDIKHNVLVQAYEQNVQIDDELLNR
jgi:hypothetical protein